MRTKIDVATRPGGFSVIVTASDGQKMELHYGSIERTANVSRFLLEAFTKEHLAAIDDAHRRVIETLDRIEGQIAVPSRAER